MIRVMKCINGKIDSKLHPTLVNTDIVCVIPGSKTNNFESAIILRLGKNSRKLKGATFHPNLRVYEPFSFAKLTKDELTIAINYFKEMLPELL